MPEFEPRPPLVPPFIPSARADSDADTDFELMTAPLEEELRPQREGLPPGYRMRTEAHYVDQLVARAPVPQVRAGRLRALAVTSRTRAPALPEVPTMAEAGMPDYEVVLWTSLFAPAGTPRAVVEAIHGQVVKSLQLPDVRERLAGIGVDAGPTAEIDVPLMMMVPLSMTRPVPSMTRPPTKAVT